MSKLSIAKELLKCLALGALCATIIGGAALVWRLPKIINQQADKTRSALLAETAAAILTADGRLAEALGIINQRSGEALAEVQSATVDADARAGQALDIVRGAAEGSNEQLSRANETLAAAIKPVAETAQQIDDALPYIIDCDPSFAGADCLPNRYLEIANETEKTLKAVAAAAPSMATSVDAIATSSAGVADSADETGKQVVIAAKRFNAPQTKMQQLRSWLLTLARVYGAI